jgi:hypothetical protein
VKKQSSAYQNAERTERNAMKSRMAKEHAQARKRGTAKLAREKRSSTGANAGTIGGTRRIDPRAFFGRS